MFQPVTVTHNKNFKIAPQRHGLSPGQRAGICVYCTFTSDCSKGYQHTPTTFSVVEREVALAGIEAARNVPAVNTLGKSELCQLVFEIADCTLSQVDQLQLLSTMAPPLNPAK